VENTREFLGQLVDSKAPNRAACVAETGARKCELRGIQSWSEGSQSVVSGRVETGAGLEISESHAGVGVVPTITRLRQKRVSCIVVNGSFQSRNGPIRRVHDKL